MLPGENEVLRFRQMIFSWWSENKRDLPWRHTYDPYRILVSEIMLQQTQVARVLPKYREFLSVFPDVSSLAAAATHDVLIMWRGMGYNRRALYLKKTAEVVVQKYNSIFPKDEKLLLKLPGLGIYTARALMVFAYKSDVAMIDTNIRQIITHFFFNGTPQKDKSIQTVADLLVPAGKSWEWHQALMDYGSLELPKLKPKSPKQRKATIPFKESNRYYRGRIIDVLRVGKIEVADLVSSMVNEYTKPPEFFEKLLDTLQKDGLVVRYGKQISLPS